MSNPESIGVTVARAVELLVREGKITGGIQHERKRMRAKRKGDDFERRVARILADHLGFDVATGRLHEAGQ